MKNNVFGSKLTYNPIPQLLQIELIGAQKSGKSTLATQLCKPGIVLIIDSDGRFNEVVPENSSVEFYPVSDHLPDMLDVNSIHEKIFVGMPQIRDKASMIIVDSATSIFEPIVNEIQRLQETKQLTQSATAFKPKAMAMKTLRDSVNHWGVDTLWIYHTDTKTDHKGKQSQGRTLSDLEIARLGRSINLTLEVIIDDSGKRGVKVLEARRGRSGITIWDDSGSWQDFRNKITQAVWGGLTQQDQQVIEETLPTSFPDAPSALRWGWTYSENNGQFFSDAAHAKNSLQKLSAELREELGDEFSYDILWQMWVEKVINKSVKE